MEPCRQHVRLEAFIIDAFRVWISMSAHGMQSIDLLEIAFHSRPVHVLHWIGEGGVRFQPSRVPNCPEVFFYLGQRGAGDRIVRLAVCRIQSVVWIDA